MDSHKINSYGIPDQTASDEMKSSMDYGNSVANYISNEWFVKDTNVNTFYDGREEIESLRLYARGEQDPSQYKTYMGADGDLSFLNLDWKPIPVIPKYVDLIVNGMQDRLFDFKATAQDKVATNKKKADLDELKAEMELKEELTVMSQAAGVDLFTNDRNSLPESTEEYEIYTQLHYKQQVEIAAETTINYVAAANRYHEIKERTDRDQVEVGMSVVKHSYEPEVGLKIEYVDPADIVHSYSNDPHFDDVYYVGEIKRINVSDLVQMFPELANDEEKIKRIRQAGAAHYDNFGIGYTQVQENDDKRESNKVEVMFFCWKTYRNVIHKIRENRKGGKTAVRRDETFSGPKGDDAKFERTHKVEEVVYEGVKVLGDDTLLLKWKPAENMVRPKSSEANVVLPYIMSAANYNKGMRDSMVKRITQFADKIHIIDLQIQKLIQKVVPPGLRIDPDAVAAVDMGNGTNMNLREVINMYTQTGTIFARSLNADGDPVGGEPIRELPGSQMIQLQGLLASQQYYYDQISKATGINDARDAGDPDPKALVGVQKLAAANSNTATRHITKASEAITKRVGEAIVLRMQDVLEHHNDEERYRMAIGRANVAVIDSLKDMHLHDFGIELELEPDEEEKQFLEQNIQQALQQQMIFLDDAIDVRSIKNIKLANQVLKLRRKKKFEQDQREAQQNQEHQAQLNTQSAQAAEQAKMQAAQTLTQSEIQKEEAVNNFAMMKLNAEKEAEKEILMLKHQLQLDIIAAQQVHENAQNTKKLDSAERTANQKISSGAGQGSTGGISINNQANTIDGKTMGRGLLG